MPRRLAMACVALLTLAVGDAHAQVSFGTNSIPGRTALARVNLDRQFTIVVPLNGPEKLTQLSIDAGMLFAQTNNANFYAFDAETGRSLWVAHLGDVTTRAQPASVNSDTVFVANSNELYALDRATGRVIWNKEMGSQPSSSTAADETRVMIGLESGKLVVYDTKTGKELWNIQSNSRISSHPVMAGRVVAFGSEDRKLYMSRSDNAKLLWRFATGGPIVAPIGKHGLRTLLVPSSDKAIYAVDLFTGVSKWILPTGAPVEQEPLVADDDVYVVNTEGYLSAIHIPTGELSWTVSTLGGRLISVSATKVYLESHDEDLFVVDRATGKIIYDPATTFHRVGINLRDYALGPTNRFDDRLYLGTTHGLVICLREIGQVAPRPNRDPKSKPFGYIPPEGYDDLVIPIPVTPPVEGVNPTDPK
jgi:outer membrane protein assembly factor BamB